MTQELQMQGQITSFELGPSGTQKDGTPWQMYKYKIKPQGETHPWTFSGFDQHPVNIGDWVQVTYTETPNPKGKYPYKNIQQMQKLTGAPQTPMGGTSSQGQYGNTGQQQSAPQQPANAPQGNVHTVSNPAQHPMTGRVQNIVNEMMSPAYRQEPAVTSCVHNKEAFKAFIAKQLVPDQILEQEYLRFSTDMYSD